MSDLPPRDAHYVSAAEGWLGLGDHCSAEAELDEVTPAFRSHSAVLHARWAIHAASGNWLLALAVAEALTISAPEDPRAWLHRSFALHELKRTSEARENLVSVISRFPEYALMHYNLGCYECQLGNLAMAHKLVTKAFELPGGKELKSDAFSDPDLAPLWRNGPRL